MADYTLHCFAQSGNAYKVALMLELSRAIWRPVFVDFFHGEARSESFRKINPMGEVPVLEAVGRTMTQSGAILHHLARTLGRFGPTDDAQADEVLRWMFWDNHKLTANLATWRFMTNFLPEEKRSADVIGFLEGRARAALGVLDAHLASRDWIVGDGPGIADLSAAGYVFYDDQYPVDWQGDYPNVVAWRERIRTLPGWQHPYELMPGHPIPGRG